MKKIEDNAHQEGGDDSSAAELKPNSEPKEVQGLLILMSRDLVTQKEEMFKNDDGFKSEVTNLVWDIFKHNDMKSKSRFGLKPEEFRYQS